MTIELKPLPARPLVSIIAPSFNQGEYIGQTITSILGQTYRPLEMVVVDGGSTDKTVDVLKRMACEELKWTSEKDSGVVEAVNKGFGRVKGDIVGIQSSDDSYANAGVVAKAVSVFGSNPDAGVVYGDIQKVDGDGRHLPTASLSPFTMEAFLCKKTRIPQESAFFRREVREAAGLWREEVAYAADTDLFLRMAFLTSVVKLDEVFALRCMHAGQRDDQACRIVECYARMIDTNTDISKASPRLQRAAEAGKYLTAYRYNPSGSLLTRTLNLYRAKWVFPDAFAWSEVSWRERIPGYVSCLRMLSRIKRKMLGRAKTGHRSKESMGDPRS